MILFTTWTALTLLTVARTWCTHPDAHTPSDVQVVLTFHSSSVIHGRIMTSAGRSGDDEAELKISPRRRHCLKPSNVYTRTDSRLSKGLSGLIASDSTAP
ncbi:hypothetical protein EDD37DRAFT_156658 [Exophiala viscosa]|uniref:uncharacterized protein n=1 Tax=Exophiala viscosa TaxID=2486360 RepID=UPI00218E742E|nr:hypothetical protein EDD37DRAFT_156658 [Exophiala viscosa]